ncbi:hypothetical protein AXF42_Ash021726 [Apostasia shenzhenica]|uniref:Retrotransposon gag domain-containing protein n=1 Tax=Apostasia shenzhenica TaxID=1088818 RepID=A0A2H9ZSN0_9ASPA|nr:hypothetical protein AXF42_Ash021726 [Apostasia shenzhenica]
MQVPAAPVPPPQRTQEPEEPRIDRVVGLLLKMRPPRFEGIINPTVAEHWMCKVEKIFKSIHCPENRKASLAASILDVTVDGWWINYQQVRLGERVIEVISWEEFLQVFQSKYVPPSAKDKMISKLLRLVQWDMSVLENEAKFADLAKYVPQLVTSETDRCRLFR